MLVRLAKHYISDKQSFTIDGNDISITSRDVYDIINGDSDKREGFKYMYGKTINNYVFNALSN